jgi:hypothetical protein
MLYVAADRYLKDRGKLGFVITQTVFKTEGGGEGFRRLQLGDGLSLKAIQVDDFSEVQCFEGATNRTALFVLQKGIPTKYPVPYTFWRKQSRRNIPTDADYDEAMGQLRSAQWVARPISASKKNSPWISGRPRALENIENVIGNAAYDGRAGSCTWLNGVYWVEVVGERKDGLLLVNNLHDTGRSEVRNVNMAIEPDFVFPLLRGRDVQRWMASPASNIIIPQDPSDPAKGVPEGQMRTSCPKTYAYFKQFAEQLRKRSGFKQFFDVNTAPFYSVYNVGPYTFERHKVVWREQASTLTAAVASTSKAGKPIIPDHKLMLCPGETAEEVHYICGLLNSVPAQFIVKSYSISTSISTHVFRHVGIRRFDPKDKTHITLASNSQRLHKAVAAGDLASVTSLEAENLHLAGAYWGLNQAELEEVRASLDELN